MRRVIVGVLALAMLVAGCGDDATGGADRSSDSSPWEQRRTDGHYAEAGLAFAHPTEWLESSGGSAGSLSRVLVFVTPQPVHNPCSTGGGMTTCGYPVDELEPGGVLVTWTAHTRPGPAGATTSSTAVPSVTTERPGLCSELRGDVSITATIASTDPYVTFRMLACLREPTAATETQVHEMLASVRVAPTSPTG